MHSSSAKAWLSRSSLLSVLLPVRCADRAVQVFGGLGVKKGVKVEELYRDIRALRIYEGATEVQKIVIARDLMKAAQAGGLSRAAE